ncbi:YcxB family protein [Inconstantimicrobium mannanitabidum]|uniref:Uncharacterized protein n=1 Tax=Inconstantimicrobium mannanitabidum TaxID=1604901 RepID=A0ACB5RGZ8_9CLOT|nr:YcxB family protein [Clostridium sp. TW13]GKX68365.1 hypothetical protein rsdtw13_36230 [Clostridium sp. TW13]
MEVTYTNTFEDLVDIYTMRYMNNSENKKIIYKGKVAILLSIILITLGLSLIFYQFQRFFVYPILYVGLVTVFIVRITYPDVCESRLREKIIEQLKEVNYKLLLTPIKLNLADGSIKEEKCGNIRIIPWKYVRKVDIHDKKIYLKLGSIDTLIIPEAAFNNVDERDFFTEYVFSHTSLEKKEINRKTLKAINS